eukprot:TRINITY_DN77864_c0_g1_i1.p1 TRINITY_DN77864_c0_g1~~TRINITY_DN77864_c0_g1_i1.p1  ORF type:complete len:323 (+),score=42.37 TRINITY_DN77864_c0_g1_i1:64-1032(+)
MQTVSLATTGSTELKGSVDDAQSATAADGKKFMCKFLRCKSIVMEQTCRFGDGCAYAHSPAELQPTPEEWKKPIAAHWQGQVSLGVVEHAMFWDLPPVGVVDVVCNRLTCLGNPFGGRKYGPGDVRAEADEEGWVPAEHVDLCDSFREYLSIVLDRNADPDEDLAPVAERISAKRSLFLVDMWEAQHLKRADVLRAIDALCSRVSAGKSLRLLCHCRPHVRCHAELLKAHLDQYVPSVPLQPEENKMQVPGSVDCLGCEWPGFGNSAPPCVGSTRSWSCGRSGRALDPGSLELYCAVCWSWHSVRAKRVASVESRISETGEV